VRYYKETAPSQFTVWHDDSSAFVAHLAVARHPERDRIRKLLQDFGVLTEIHYPVLDCDQPSQQGLPGVAHDLSFSRQVVKEIFTLPCFPEMTEEEVFFVCECLQKTG
jgi:aminotransferase EvaB